MNGISENASAYKLNGSKIGAIVLKNFRSKYGLKCPSRNQLKQGLSKDLGTTIEEIGTLFSPNHMLNDRSRAIITKLVKAGYVTADEIILNIKHVPTIKKRVAMTKTKASLTLLKKA